jgi:hypothetical protein
MVNLPIEYSDKKITPFGGMVLLKHFLDKLEIEKELESLALPKKGSNRSYSSKEIIEPFWLSIWTGASRFIHSEWLRYDNTLQEIFGFKKMPSQSTYSRFFGKFSQSRNTEVFPKLQKFFIDKVRIEKITLDLDSTVITRYGQQEGSAKGYNPRKRGRNSHHPLIAFVSQTRTVANAWLRPGNTADSSSCKSFLEETFNEVLKSQDVGLLRADSGFYSSKILEYLEEKNQNYIIAVKMYPNIKSSIYQINDWVELHKGISVSQMYFNHRHGKQRRYLVVRKEINLRPKSSGKQLFADLPGYRYSCFVTNMDLPLDSIWNLYNGRADCENRIKELKQDFGLENFCMKDFWATEASFRFIMAAYNIISLFRFFALQTQRSSTMRTLKLYCFALGAWTTNHANRKVLKIALPVKRRQWMDGVFSQIKSIVIPFDFSIA